MARPETLSVRLEAETRAILDELADSRGSAGASALAREILETWAREQRNIQRRADVDRIVRYIHEHPEGWDDEPEDFFRGQPVS